MSVVIIVMGKVVINVLVILGISMIGIKVNIVVRVVLLMGVISCWVFLVVVVVGDSFLLSICLIFFVMVMELFISKLSVMMRLVIDICCRV